MSSPVNTTCPLCGSRIVKPGWQTTEFWLTLVATFCSIVMASGFVGPESLAGTIVGGILAVLSVLGYSVSRALAKSGQWTNDPKVYPVPPPTPNPENVPPDVSIPGPPPQVP